MSNEPPTDESQSQPFFKSPKDWSRIKIRVLDKYLQPFCYKLGSTYHDVFLVDGFAGAGRYETGQDGSPLVGAKWALRMRDEGRPFHLRCINVEADELIHRQLARNLKPYADSGLVKTYKGRFEDHLRGILAEVGDSPTLFFIDPFGVEHIDQDSLAPLRLRTAKTELLLRLDTPYILRMLGQDKALRSDSESVRRAAQTILDKVSSIFGADKSAWSEELQDRWQRQAATAGGTQKAKHAAILGMYEESLKRAFAYVI
ncbi:MAG: three-Cys-motif partner protein TcmP [Planctomycetota bacterium]|nr:three-Cys-motif partner protein TcmP [Planctomycetota bacterium]